MTKISFICKTLIALRIYQLFGKKFYVLNLTNKMPATHSGYPPKKTAQLVVENRGITELEKSSSICNAWLSLKYPTLELPPTWSFNEQMLTENREADNWEFAVFSFLSLNFWKIFHGSLIKYIRRTTAIPPLSATLISTTWTQKCCANPGYESGNSKFSLVHVVLQKAQKLVGYIEP